MTTSSPLPQTVTGSRRLAFYAALLVATLLPAGGVPVLYSMLPQLFATFDSPQLVGWTVTAFWLGAAVTAAVMGRLGDLYGYRRMVLVAIGVSALGSVLALVSTGLPMLIAACTLQAISVTITPLAYGLVRVHLPGREVPFAVGILSAAGMTLAGLMFIAGGAVIDATSWRGGFGLVTAACALSAVAVWAWVPAPPASVRQASAVRWLRGLVFAPGLVAVLYGIQQAGALGATHPVVWGSVLGGLLVLAVWAHDQSRQAEPLIDVRLMQRRQVLLANLCMACVAMGAMQTGQVFSMVLQQPSATGIGQGLSATASGAWLLVGNLIALLGAPASGWVAMRRGARSATIQGMLLLALAWGWAAWSHEDLVALVVGLLACSFGLAFVQPGVYNLVMEDTPPERTGEASGLLFVLLACFFALGSQAMFAALNSDRLALAGGASFPSELAYTRALAFGAAASVLGLFLAQALPRRRKEQALPPVSAQALAD